MPNLKTYQLALNSKTTGLRGHYSAAVEACMEEAEPFLRRGFGGYVVRHIYIYIYTFIYLFIYILFIYFFIYLFIYMTATV